MDWLKYPIDKLLFFVAGIFPGGAVLLVLELSAPGTLQHFFALTFLGYRTKLILAAAFTFVVGYTMTSLLRATLGGLGGAYGGAFTQFRPSPPPSWEAPVGPWRDPRWRTALRRHLGAQAPNDSRVIGAEWFKIRTEGIGFLPQDQQLAATYSLQKEQTDSQMDDLNWSQWYDYYHRIVMHPRDKDLQAHIRFGLNINLETASIFLLVSSIFVPSLRHWWVFVPSIFWLTMLASEEYAPFVKIRNKWSTLDDQITYLSELQPLSQSRSVGLGAVPS